MSVKFKDENGCISDEFLDTFGREFYKHETLWKPKPNWKQFQIQSATKGAYKKIALALHLSVKEVLELSQTFPAACLDLMSRYEMMNQVNAMCRVPDWLTTLVEHFRLLHNNQKDTNFTTSPDLVRSLCASAWAGLAAAGGGAGGGAGAEEDVSLLLDRRAVACFAETHSVKEAQILPVWRGVYRLCVTRLLSLVGAGDQAWALWAALRPRGPERGVADLALLHDCCVSQIKFLTPAKLRSLVLLFQLIVAAMEIYDKETRRGSVDGNIVATSNTSGGSEDCNVRGRSNEDESISVHSNSAVLQERCEPRPNENVNITTPIMIEAYTTNDDKKTVNTSTFDGLYNAQDKIPKEHINICNTPNPLERVIKCEPRRNIGEFGDATMEEFSDNELHTELDLEPDINVLSSDTSDNEFSNIGISVLLDENQPQEAHYNILDKSDDRHQDKESDITPKSQDFNTESLYRKGTWYEEIKCSASEEQRVVWALVYTDFIKRGRSASLISLQHRWVEVLHRAREALLAAWSSDTRCDRNVHPLLLVVAHRFPDIVTKYLPSWKTLVSERQIVLESDIKDIVQKYQENNNILLNIKENLAIDGLVEEYVINVNDVHSGTRNNDTNKHLSYQEHNGIPSNTMDSNDKVEGGPVEEELKSQNSAVNNVPNANNCISTILDQIDPSKAKVSIIFDDDSDEDVIDENRLYKTEITPVLNSDKEPTFLRNQKDLILQEKFNKLFENALKNIEKEQQDKLHYIYNPGNQSSKLFIGNNRIELNKHINDDNEIRNDKENLSYDFESQVGSLLQPREKNVREDGSNSQYQPVIDEKLFQLSRVVITPIEHLPEWKKHSRNGIVKCRNFSVKNFTKPVMVNSNQLFKCRPYVNTNIDTFNVQDNCIRSEKSTNEHESKNCKRLRIKFEDNNFETDFGVIDDVNNGIKYQKYIELYSMPEKLKKNRIKLTKKLNLPRTYFSLNFWCLERNIELLKLCKPMRIKLSRVLPGITNRVLLIYHLSDINRASRTNESFTTAQVSPYAPATTTTDAQRSNASQEVLNFTNKSISSDSITRQTNNSISSALDSSQSLKVLTNYASHTNTQKNTIESKTKDNTCGDNLMDCIIETMRTAEEDNNRNSTAFCTLNSLQQNPLTKSNQSQFLMSSNPSTLKSVTSTDTSYTVQESTEEERNNQSINSINNSLINTTPINIHISSDSTKELYIKHVQKMENEFEKSKTLNVSELKDMILLLTKKCNSKDRHKYDDGMKLNKSNFNIQMKMYRKQHRFLIKYLSKLNKILPEYALNVEPKEKPTKNATSANKQENVNLITQEQAQENLKLCSDNANDILDISNNRNSVIVDDDCEPKLVIDEQRMELNDNNSEANTININKNKQDTTTNKRKKVKKDNSTKKTIITKDETALQVNDKTKGSKRKAKKKHKESKEILEEKEPVLNEYQEWERQKTMALKYFAIPMTDTSKLTPKYKTAPQISKTVPTKQSNGCQTLIPIKRKNTEDSTSTRDPDITKRLKLPNEDDIVCISDDSSDDDVQITECNIPHAAANFNKQLENNKLQNINQIIILNDTLKEPVVDPNVCVINTTVAAISQPLYIIINGAPMPTTSQDNIIDINNPPFLQVLSNATPFPTKTEILQTPLVLTNNKNKSEQLSETGNSLPCQKPFNNIYKRIESQEPARDNTLCSTLKSVQDVALRDSTNSKPPISLLKRNNRPIKEAITVKEYLLDNKKLKALIKVNGSQNLVFFCKKYIILTDDNISSEDATYRTIFKTKKYRSLIQVLAPSDSEGSVLHLGFKRESDYMSCRCIRGAQIKCNLCYHTDINSPNNTNYFKIENFYYKKMCDKPIKYVRLTRKEVRTNSSLVLEGNPDRILVSRMYFKKLMDSPLTYVRILSSVPDAATLRLLVRKEVLLYAFDVTQAQYYHTPLTYSLTAGHITVEHSDDNLVQVLQYILN